MYRDESRWIAFIDIDEFLFSPTRAALPLVLEVYEPWPAVAVGITIFGSSGHREKPPGLVTENYLQRADVQHMRVVKSVVDPKRTVSCETVHNFQYRDLPAADENGYPVKGAMLKWVSLSRLRINHYYMRSEEEFRRKCATPQAANARFRTWPDLVRLRSIFNQTDESLLEYAPRLRAAINESTIGGRLGNPMRTNRPTQ
jgi:hypothetical protein